MERQPKVAWMRLKNRNSIGFIQCDQHVSVLAAVKLAS